MFSDTFCDQNFARSREKSDNVSFLNGPWQTADENAIRTIFRDEIVNRLLHLQTLILRSKKREKNKKK